MPLLNPLLVAMVVIIPILLLTGIPYDHYFQGSKILNDLLQPAVVALAFPLYEQLHQIRARWKSIITICFCGSPGGDDFRYRHRPADGRNAGNRRVGVAEIGHHTDCDGRRRQHRRYPRHQRRLRDFRWRAGSRLRSYLSQSYAHTYQIRPWAGDGHGFACAGHRARCAEVDYQEGAFSSLALVICGIITSLVAPFLFPLIVAVLR